MNAKRISAPLPVPPPDKIHVEMTLEEATFLCSLCGKASGGLNGGFRISTAQLAGELGEGVRLTACHLHGVLRDLKIRSLYQTHGMTNAEPVLLND